MEPTDAHCTLRPGRRSPPTVPEDDAATPELAVESRVRTRAKGLLGTARFVGAIEHLPEGVWVGVELDEPLGKSDGEVKGVRIFQCAPLHGATLRASALQLVGPDGATLHDVPGHLPPPPKARRARKAAPGGGKKPLAEYEDDFMRLLDAARPESLPARREGVVDLKASNAANGLETSSFTVCARVRPVLAHEAGQPESYAVVLPTGGARRRRSRPGACGGGAAAEVAAAAVVAKDHTEHMTVFTPTVSMMGKPSLKSAVSPFDYAFAESESNETVYEAIGRPLVTRALAGQVGVCFAYGQTGSGKTHTMNGLMDGLVEQLFEAADGRAVSMQYMESLGVKLRDCLADAAGAGETKDAGSGTKDAGNRGGIAVGEALDGRVIVRGLTSHAAPDAPALRRLVAQAQRLRSTAATERNAASSRSHGVAILTVGPPGSLDFDEAAAANAPAAGKLYIIDLAGSERAADSKNHSKERLAETKQINLSLMALKECIR